ncbi:alanine racemase [Roseomonas sp. HJA6]|uniref:alanine racemase n=1 Tax=Roseomonas alba TaxID=2846776 RepID=A0ABS7AAG4_9PROT|nr:alanine racemase [Neoroseomonas alba]MBW6399261.1 alanine racemase [Neoroseomonas alba]
MTSLRPAWVEIDLDALANNMRTMRAMAGPDCFIYAVVKGDGYGTGTVEAATVLQAHGADGIALGDPDAIAGLRAAGITVPILLYAATLPEQAASVAALDAIPTVHDLAGLEAYGALNRPMEIWVKLDCGLGRIGLPPDSWDAAFRRLAALPMLRLGGIYGHFRSPDVEVTIDRQAVVFRAGVEAARTAGLDGFRTMVAGSRLVLGHPALHLTAVNPGKALYGFVDAGWPQHHRIRPVVAALKTRVIQVKTHPPGSGWYADETPCDVMRRSVVVPLGYLDGLNFHPPGHVALLRGMRVPVLGRRGIEHMVLDASGVPDATVGDEVVFVGRQGEDSITLDELAAVIGQQPMELGTRIARLAPRRYRPVSAGG